MSDAAWIILIGFLVGASCSLLGVFLVLRRMSMIGDAVSHSILFGIVVTFLLAGGRSPYLMFIGAALVGLLTAYGTAALHHHGRVQEDASIGVVFTTLFAMAVVLISLFAGQVDLDQECVLYGEIALAPLNQMEIRGVEMGPQAAWILGVMTIVNLLFVVIGYHRLKLVSFDPLLASALGISVTFWHYLLMTFLSMTAVAAFESVGAILVVAMLVVPPNAAFLLVKSLPGMLGLSVFFALLSSIGGYYLAVWFDGSVAAGIVLTSGALLLISFGIAKLREGRGRVAIEQV